MRSSFHIRLLLSLALAYMGFIGSLSGAQIVQAEYYLGVDPGAGNGTTLALSDVSELANSIESKTIPVALPPGTYDLGVRVKDDAGRWSNPMLRRLTIQPSDYALAGDLDRDGSADQGMNDPLPGGISPLVEAEYFIGADPGNGAGTSLSLGSDGYLARDLGQAVLSLAMPPGTYTVGVRAKDDAGRWSQPMIRRFKYLGDGILRATENEIAAGDLDPEDAEQQQQWNISLPGHCLEATYQVTVAGRTIEVNSRPGESTQSLLNRLIQAVQGDPWLSSLVEVQNLDGSSITLNATAAGVLDSDWASTSANLTITLEKTGNLGSQGRKIIAAEYFVDIDPGEGDANSLPIILEASANGATQDEQIIAINALRAGGHRVGIRFRNAAGRWSLPLYRGFSSFLLFGDLDVTAPTLELLGDNPMDWPHGQAFVDPGFTAMDETDGDLHSSAIINGQVDPTLPGEQSIHYSVVDQAGNRNDVIRVVRVTDLSAPIFSGISTFNHITPPASTDVFTGITANDVESGDLSHRIRLKSGMVDWFNAGVYVLTFEVTDAAGNISTFERTVSLSANAVYYPDFGSWINGLTEGGNFDSVLLEADADPDGDGQPNWMEWSADTNPFDANSKLHLSFEGSPDMLKFRWCGQMRTKYWLESSTNLDGWDAYTQEMNTDGGSEFYIEHPLTSESSAQLFFRLMCEPRQPILAQP